MNNAVLSFALAAVVLAVVWFGSPHEPYSGLPEDLALYDDLPEKYADRAPVGLTSIETGRRVKRPLGEVLHLAESEPANVNPNVVR